MAIQSPLGNRATNILDLIGNAFGMNDEEEKRKQGAIVGDPIQQPSLKVGPMQFGEPQNMEQLQVQQQMQEQNARMMKSPMPQQAPQASSPDQIKGKVAETAVKQMAAGGDRDPGFMSKVQDYFGDEGNMLRLAMAFNTMRLNPDQQLTAYAAKRLESLDAQRSTQSAAQGIARQLAEMGYKEHAQAALSNPALAKDIYNAVVKSQLDTGAKSTIGKLQSDLAANRITQEQYDSEVNRLAESSKPDVITLGGGEGWGEDVNKTYIDRFSTFAETGSQAARNVQLIQSLETSLANVPTGVNASIASFAGSLGLKSDYASDLEAAEAIISQLVPQQRPPGSGVMSDADLALFKKSLPNIMNTPGGNMKIMNTIKQMALYDIERGKIADRALFDPQYTPQMAVEDIAKLNDPLAWLTGSEATAGTQPVKQPRVRKYDANGNLITE